MSYTTKVRSICEYKAGLIEPADYSEIESVIEKSWDKIFSNIWETYDPDYKKVLCSKILRHYYTREICAETTGLWLHWLNAKMSEIIPYYNGLYKSASLEFNPLNDVDITTTRTETGNSSEDGSRTSDTSSTRTDDLHAVRTDNLHSASSDSHYNLFNDTPQGGLSAIDNLTYLTTATKVYGTDSTDNTGTQSTANTGTQNITGGSDETNTKNVSTTNEYIERVAGKRSGASYSKMIEEFRKTLLNIDELIIKELKDLFFNLY